MTSASSGKYDKGKLFVCFDCITEEIFYASLSELKGSSAQISSSHRLDKGEKFLMMPIPKEWDGKKFSKEMIFNSTDSFEANVSRTKGKGVYQIRIFSHKDHNVMDRVRTGGKLDADTLKIHSSLAGLVGTMVLKGVIGVPTAARIQSALNDLHKERRLILLDLTELNYFANSGIGIFYTILKEKAKQGMNIKLLVKEGSHIHELLTDSKIREEFELYFNRDEAVTSLLSSELE